MTTKILFKEGKLEEAIRSDDSEVMKAFAFALTRCLHLDNLLKKREERDFGIIPSTIEDVEANEMLDIDIAGAIEKIRYSLVSLNDNVKRITGEYFIGKLSTDSILETLKTEERFLRYAKNLLETARVNVNDMIEALEDYLLKQ